MPIYRMTVEVVVDVDARDRETAVRRLQESPPRVSVTGWDVSDGGFAVQSRPGPTIKAVRRLPAPRQRKGV